MEEIEKIPTIQYYFSHIMLRNLVFSDTKTFVKNVALDANSMYHFLDYFWSEAIKEEPTLVNIEGEPKFELSKSKFENGVELVLIKMPEPKQIGDAYFVALTLEENLRYFTLEKSESQFDKRPMNILSEWVLHNEHFHNNTYGEIDNLREGYLCGVIEAICKEYPSKTEHHD
ncbi:MAG: hypothetical protein WCX32_01615 [Clostridia bacterium]|jgi:hypothetical protein|nr:hypothetical protein [Clostridia bacterium]